MKTGKKLHQCKVCERQFTRSDGLERHIKHTSCGGADRLKFPCLACGRLFSRRDKLLRHLGTQKNCKNCKYSCEQCGYKFTFPALFDTHDCINKIEKQFSCDSCNTTFMTAKALKQHHPTCTSKFRYRCEYCSARFLQEFTLYRHLRIHTGVETGNKKFPHSCSLCSGIYKSHGSLVRHMRKGHPEFLEQCTSGPDLEKCNASSSNHKEFSDEDCGKCISKNNEENDDDDQKNVYEGMGNTDLAVSFPATPIEYPILAKGFALSDEALAASVCGLLPLLTDEASLKSFGWPDKPIIEILEAILRRYGQTPVSQTENPVVNCLRENCKLLFSAVIDSSDKTFMNYCTVDEVIMHILRLATASVRPSVF